VASISKSTFLDYQFPFSEIDQQTRNPPLAQRANSKKPMATPWVKDKVRQSLKGFFIMRLCSLIYEESLQASLPDNPVPMALPWAFMKEPVGLT